jgi:serine/threonine protein kinase
LGVVLFEMLTGRLPFAGASPIETAMRHIDAAPPKASSIEPSVPPSLDRLVDQLLQKDPGRRPASAELLRVSIKEVRKKLGEASTQLELQRPRPQETEQVPAVIVKHSAFDVPTPSEPSPGPITTRIETPAPKLSTMLLIGTAVGLALLGVGTTLLLTSRPRPGASASGDLHAQARKPSALSLPKEPRAGVVPLHETAGSASSTKGKVRTPGIVDDRQRLEDRLDELELRLSSVGEPAPRTVDLLARLRRDLQRLQPSQVSEFAARLEKFERDHLRNR